MIFKYNSQVYPSVLKLKLAPELTQADREYIQSFHAEIDEERYLINNCFSLSQELLEGFPSVNSLEVYKCYYKGASQLNSLIALKNLKELKIKFMVKVRSIVPRENDIVALRKLLQNLENCEIKFATPRDFDFIDRLAELLITEKFEIYERGENKFLKIVIKY